MKSFYSHIVLSMFVLFMFSISCEGQTTAFNFQGRLNDGTSPANGRYDLQFRLFGAITGGNQVGSNLDRPNLLLINGVFSTTLDFGASAFSAGNRFLEILVRPAGGSNAYVVLGSRQQILSVPFAVRAATSVLADSAVFALDANYAQNAVTAENAVSLGGVGADNYARLNFANSGNMSAANISAAANLSVGGNAVVTGQLTVSGNVIQPAGSFGSPKALLRIFGDGGIASCYNGITGASTLQTCGFVVTEPLGGGGVYRVNFNFPVAGRFVIATSEYRGSNSLLHNTVPQYQFFNSTTIEFFLTRINSSTDTFDAAFMVIVF